MKLSQFVLLACLFIQTGCAKQMVNRLPERFEDMAEVTKVHLANNNQLYVEYESYIYHNKHYTAKPSGKGPKRRVVIDFSDIVKFTNEEFTGNLSNETLHKIGRKNISQLKYAGKNKWIHGELYSPITISDSPQNINLNDTIPLPIYKTIDEALISNNLMSYVYERSFPSPKSYSQYYVIQDSDEKVLVLELPAVPLKEFDDPLIKGISNVIYPVAFIWDVVTFPIQMLFTDWGDGGIH